MPSIQAATSLNYLQMRLIALLFDLLAADTANMFFHLSLGGLEGMWLNWVGSFYGLGRLSGEDDTQYKRRLLETLAQPQENNIAIAALVSQAFGVAEVIAQDYQLFWCILYVFGSLANPRLVMPFVKSIAPAGIIWTGINIPPGGSLTGAVAGHTRAGTYSDVRFKRPPRWGISGGDRWYDAVATPLSGEFAILH